jgi:hypothetical protein
MTGTMAYFLATLVSIRGTSVLFSLFQVENHYPLYPCGSRTFSLANQFSLP